MWQLIAYACVAFAVGLYCLLMPVSHLGFNPVTRTHNPNFDEEKARSGMWIVRTFGVLLVALGAVCVVLAV